jgi:uncharacterized protein
MTTYVLFHAKKVNPFVPCIDGLYAAHAAKQAMPSAKLVPAMYGVDNVPKLNLVEDDLIYLIDLTYPAFVLEGWANAGAMVAVLDHHKSAMQDLSGLSAQIYSEFDMSRSGAVMAWQHFFPSKPVPEVFQYVQDRDIWTKQLPDCDTVHLGMLETFDGKTLGQCIKLIPTLTIDYLKEVGAKVKTEVDAAVEYAVKHHKTRIAAGHVVPFFRCKTKRDFQAYSDIGHVLARLKLKTWVFGKPTKPAPFAVIQTGGGWALRSSAEGLDVSEIAKQIGGGGHKAASGARAAEWW